MNPSSTLSSVGYLGLFIGSMFSGKTSKLTEIHRKYTFISKKVIVVNFAGDTRYSTENMVSHDGIQIPCIMSDNIHRTIAKHFTDFESADVILVNEGQFFEDLYDATIYLVETMKKRVYIAGLDGDFKQEKFGQILDLIPKCDDVVKLHAICSVCRDGTPAIFSMRISDEADQVLIGTTNYSAVCRECFPKNNTK